MKKNNMITVLSREKYLRQMAASGEPLDICLTNDYAFRKIFKNKTVAKGFVMALLDFSEDQITEIEIVDPYEEGESDGEKEGILDIKVHLNHSQKINIEMQNRFQEDWSDRSVFYNCRMFTDGFLHGIPYGSMEPCIHVGILNFNQLKSPGFHHLIMLLDDKTKEVYSSKFIFHVLELKKLKEASGEEKEQELYRWARLIAAQDWEAVCMEAKGNPYMETAVDEMDKINQSETERYLYLRREMAICDEKSRLVTAEHKGMADGLELGREQGLTQGIKASIKICQELGATAEDTLSKLCQKFSLSDEKAKRYMDQYWRE